MQVAHLQRAFLDSADSTRFAPGRRLVPRLVGIPLRQLASIWMQVGLFGSLPWKQRTTTNRVGHSRSLTEALWLPQGMACHAV